MVSSALKEPKILIYMLEDDGSKALTDSIDFGSFVTGGKSNIIKCVFSVDNPPSISNVKIEFDGIYHNREGEFVLDSELGLIISEKPDLVVNETLKNVGDSYRIKEKSLVPNTYSQPYYFAIESINYVQKGPRIARIGFSYEIP